MPLLVPLLTYVTYATLARANGDVLGLAKAFTSFSLFVLLIKPLGLIVVALPAFASAAASIARVQEYLCRQEREPRASLLIGTSPNEKSHAASEENSRNDVEDMSNMRETVHRRSDLSSDILISASGQLQWSDAEKSEPILALKELTIHRGTFTVILGPVACGKSTLMKLFLGELPQFEGHLDVRTCSTAYCAQEPFIPSRTCREVIVGNVPYDPLFYTEVIKACALEADFQRWPQGDASTVGNAGTTLSGGQKQRLALARAVYSRKELAILDDSLTGLDASTEATVFENLLGREGLLRRPGVSVVLATSSPRHAPHADRVLLLSAEGTNIDEGSFAELRSRSAVFSSVNLSDDEDRLQKLRGLRQSQGQLGADTAEGLNTKVNTALLQSNQNEVKLNRPARDTSVYRYYLGSAGRDNLVIFAACLCCLAFFDTFPSK